MVTCPWKIGNMVAKAKSFLSNTYDPTREPMTLAQDGNSCNINVINKNSSRKVKRILSAEPWATSDNIRFREKTNFSDATPGKIRTRPIYSNLTVVSPTATSRETWTVEVNGNS